MSVFHLALPIKDKEQARNFYANMLGCAQGREAESWIDFNFFGHQLSLHVKAEAFDQRPLTNDVDGKAVPVKHFGAVLDWDEWHILSKRLIAENTDFIIEPYIRFEGEIGEQATMFFCDPCGNALEFKAFKDPAQIFAA